MNRGHDPRDFTLVAFGGGRPHARWSRWPPNSTWARVVVPRAADVFSAWGMLMSELRRDYFITRLMAFDSTHVAVVNGLLDEVTTTVLAQFAAEGVDGRRVRFQRFAKLRYENQEHSVEVALPGRPARPARERGGDRGVPRGLRARCTPTGWTQRWNSSACTWWRAADVGKLEPAKLTRSGRTLQAARKGRREVDYALEGVHDADILRWRDAPTGNGVPRTGRARDARHHGVGPPEQLGERRRLRQFSHPAGSRRSVRRLRMKGKSSMNDGYDPITLEIVQNSLQAIA